MKKYMNKVKILCLTAAVFSLAGGLLCLHSHAKETARIMQVISDEQTIKAYVKGMESGTETAYQIGNIPVETYHSYSLEDDCNPVRTLIMIDNSVSIPESSQKKMKEVIRGIIDNHGTNEQFRIAVFSDEISYLSDTYSDDYTALNNVVMSIEHRDQETYITDVLYDVTEELNQDNYFGYTRIIVISDGMDNKDIGITREELFNKLNKTSYPVYTIGCSTGKNGEQLENMFAFSRLTNAEYCILEETSQEDIVSAAADSNELTVFEASIPETAKTGGIQSSRLTLDSGMELVFDVVMPFAVKEEETVEAEPIENSDMETAVSDKAAEEKNSDEMQEKSVKDIFPVILAVLIIGVAAAVIIIVVLSKRKKKNTVKAAGVAAREEDSYSKTEIIGGKEFSETIQLIPDSDGNLKRKYEVTLMTLNAPERTFRNELADEITIGRMTDNNIVIGDDAAVHGHHCILSNKDGVFYITDLKNVKNHSSVNGYNLVPDIPQLLVSGSLITIGRHTYKVNFEEI